jgi:hypothetical protein
VGADGRDVAAVLEEGERHLPGFAGLLIHDGRIAASLRVISFALALATARGLIRF